MAKITKKTSSKKTKANQANNKINREISYKNYEYLARFMNDRAKVYGKKQTNLPAKLQRKLTREIKRARHLALLPFKANI